MMPVPGGWELPVRSKKIPQSIPILESLNFIQAYEAEKRPENRNRLPKENTNKLYL
jgi:hypothetical protein